MEFPKDFIFGFGTSSYQIEGAVNEDEREHSIWDAFCNRPGNIKDSSSGSTACDHYHRYSEDIALMKELNAGNYLFSIAWTRVIKDSKPNIKGIDFYQRLVDGLLEEGIQPFAKLYHWDLPDRLQTKGGWTNRDTAYRFAEYADHITRALGDKIKHWISHNEPWCATFLGMYHGEFAPGYGDLKETLSAAHNILLSHGLAAEPVRRNVPNTEYGIAPNYVPVYPATEDADDIAAAKRFDGYFNRWFFDPVFGLGYPADMVKYYGESMPDIKDGDMEIISTPIDFLGVNYYNALLIKDNPGGNIPETESVPMEGVKQSADREIYPQGLYDSLLRIQSAYQPKAIFITENGAAFDDPPLVNGRINDQERIDFFREHFENAHKAMSDGVPLKGYFIWTLLDNFEWSSGYTLKYGVVNVDFATQKRTIKDSGYMLQALFGSGQLGN